MIVNLKKHQLNLPKLHHMKFCREIWLTYQHIDVRCIIHTSQLHRYGFPHLTELRNRTTVTRDGSLGFPSAACILIKVITGVDTLVQAK